MKKSVYSLVLMDDVIKAVDEQAYRLGTSRSNLINRILAEHFSCVTPERRMKDIFDTAAALIGDSLIVGRQQSDAFMTLKTALDYKYRPTVSYRVELERSPQSSLGTLRVRIRTQSEALSELFGSFFAYLIRLEKAELAVRGYGNYFAELSAGSFTRGLLNSGLDEESAGRAIGDYLNWLNKSVQIYFSSPQGFRGIAPGLEAEYRKMLETNII